MQKVIREGKVAVLVSKGFGAGWYSWNYEHPELLFHPKIVEMVEQGRTEEINQTWVEANLGLEDIYCGGAYQLSIQWLPVGTRFTVAEYDGSESLKTINDLVLVA